MVNLRARGFTLIELLVVLAVLATLLSIAVPRYFNSIDKSREAALRQDLAVMRDAIDKYHGDRGMYPETLEDLVTNRYLRGIPVDPITETSESWQIVPPPEGEKGAVYDVKSGAQGAARDGSDYAEW